MQMLAFSQLPYLLLSDTALGFWTALLQQASPRAESVAKLDKPPLPLDVAAALIDLAGGPPRQQAILVTCTDGKSLRRAVVGLDQALMQRQAPECIQCQLWRGRATICHQENKLRTRSGSVAT